MLNAVMNNPVFQTGIKPKPFLLTHLRKGNSLDHLAFI